MRFAKGEELQQRDAARPVGTRGGITLRAGASRPRALRPWIVTLLIVLPWVAAQPACVVRSLPEVPGAPAQAVVKGTVSYHERVALPDDAEVDVWIADVSPSGGQYEIVARTRLATNGRQVPLPFEIAFDPAAIEPHHMYAVVAVIRSGSDVLFESGSVQHVITLGHPTWVDLYLVRPAPSGS